jgi:heme oxygenase (mycobilin-producing)
MVEFVNCFEVPAGGEDAFFAVWEKVNTHMRGRPGYLGHELFRSLSPQATFRFVNHARWESVDAWQAAHDETFRALVADAPFTSTPGLYEIVHTVTP